MINLLALTIFSALVTVHGCGDHDGHVHSKRAAPYVALSPPSRPLEWGDINILHTTDTHGWLLGHQKESFPEPNYSGDFGEFSSFVQRMKAIAVQKDVDLLLVDSGDLHDGSGLTDGYPPGGVNGHESNKFVQQLPYDIMAIGNHELYVYEVAHDMYKNFVPKIKGHYLSSNVNITVLDRKGSMVSVPVGKRFAKFKTRKGRKVTAFGVLFDFAGNAKNTTVQKVADMVKEEWFARAIKDEPDLFLLAGHMPVSRNNWPLVFDAIRAVHPYTPIMILGGHDHIRDCVQLDGRSMSLASGRYMETIGWMSAKLNYRGSQRNVTFSRRYLDANRVTYKFHTGRTDASFDTFKGLQISRGVKALAKKFDLGYLFGTAPRDFLKYMAPYPSENSLLSLFIEEASPLASSVNNTRASIPKIMITNSGGLRFDVFKGPFTKNDKLTTMPFSNRWVFIPNVTFSVANQVVSTLNHAGADHRRRSELASELYALGDVEGRFAEWLQDMDRRSGSERRAAGNLTIGYVTTDACPGLGDDTLHAPQPFHSIPDFIGSRPPNVTADATVDLVFVDFIQAQLIGILNSLQKEKNYTPTDVAEYTALKTNEILGVYAQHAWN
ncbi:hypothetical protein HGRIS_012387 [Hohenbuehelia grisea]|uniref:Calcineurin-like phosphoesterase domain-containing protein n=1 Tax=Hohenbuehelia grisea TaxID=104357 RepID=A0ABR3IS72_9AGAR